MKTTNESTAISKYVRASSNKISRILDQIRGKNYQEAKLILQFLPYRSCKLVKKVMDSAVYNMNKDNNNTLIIHKAYVNKGPTLKRFQPRAQGRAFPIRKPTCHIFITIQNRTKIQ